MVVFIIHLVRVPGVETEGHAVVLIHPNGITVAMQWMKPHSGHRHLRRLGRGIEGSKDQIQASRVLRLHLAGTSRLEESRESLVPETLDHRNECNLRGDDAQPLWLRERYSRGWARLAARGCRSIFNLSASIALYRHQAEAFGGRCDGKFGVRCEKSEQYQALIGAGDDRVGVAITL